MKINIYIPHHKNPALLVPLMQSLKSMKKPDADVCVILVDNASHDGSVEWVCEHYPEIVIYTLPQNLGYAPALNQAVQQYPSDWVCFLNNDMKVDENWLAALFVAADQTKSPCIGSVLMDWDGKKTQMAHGRINWFGKGFEVPKKTSDTPYSTFFACGGAMMIRRDVFLDVGGFDDDFFMIYEDVDLGWRLWLLGHEVCIAPDSKVYHLGHASLKQEDYARKAVYLERNSLAALYKNLDSSSLSVILPLAVQEAQLRAQAYSGAKMRFPYSPDGLHTVSGLQNFLENLDSWREKRKKVQSNRVIRDSDIFARFFHQPETHWAYCDEHYRRIHIPEVQKQLQTLFEQVSLLLLQPSK